MEPGTQLTYDKIAFDMIAESDNTATNILIDRFGMSAINAKGKELGLAATSLGRKMMDLNSSSENYMSANDAAKLLAGIANATIASEQMCARAKEALLAQTDNDALANGLPDGIPFAHKTGSLTNARHDGGIVYAASPYVVVVFTSNAADPDGLMATLSANIYSNLE